MPVVNGRVGPGANPQRLLIDLSAPAWQAAIASARIPERALAAAQLFAQRLDVDASLAPLARILIVAAGTGHDGASCEGLVTPKAGLRALHALDACPPALRAHVDALLSACQTDAQRAVILKGLAARQQVMADPRVADELSKIAQLIAGHDESWLLAKTTLYGTENHLGLKQAWNDSCGPTILQIALAEVDPWQCLNITLDPVPWTAVDSYAGRDQRAQLEAAGGAAVLRGSPGGRGVRDHAPILQMLQFARASVTPVERGAGFSPQVIEHAAQLLAEGVDVPLRIATDTNEAGHSVICVDVRGPPREFRVHDPWTGQSHWLDEQTLFAGHPAALTDRDPRRVTHIYLIDLPERT